ncbi:GntR family transcriptional regulator [Microbacterium sp. A93]|uniref:GntR family transcriptional regulator n=1 Tax=Microbacterium sp. A93 TaxID=3450716 RepID=UPI003F426023
MAEDTGGRPPSASAARVRTAAHAHTGAWLAQVLRERISRGELPPGTKLAEQALAEQLDVSRNTLREAFGTLSAESIVERVPNRGVFVAKPEAGDVREIYRIRRMIEPAALLWGDLTEPALAELEEIVGRAVAALEAGDVLGMADANQQLHGAIVSLAGSPTLSTVMDQTLARMRLVFNRMADAPDFHTAYAERNRHLIGLLRAGRREEAAAGLRSYLDAAESELLDHLHHWGR